MKITKNTKITPFLWFDTNLEDALEFYSSVFKSFKIINILRTDRTDSKSPVRTATFELEGHKFMALNGGPHFKFSPAISFLIECKDQDEVDYYWSKLSKGGETMDCGWVKDKFGVSWQVVPAILEKLLFSSDSKKSERALDAMHKMKKMIVSDFKKVE